MPFTSLRATILAIALSIGACSKENPPESAPLADLTGAGATFPYPLYRAWFSEYGAQAKVRINYFSVGSAEGLQMLGRGEADFGATDAAIAANDTVGQGCRRVAIPTVVGPIAVAYHLPSLTPESAPLNFDASLLAAIYSGKVNRWDAAAIRTLNAGVALPALPIVVVHRAKGSGTGRAFSEFLRQSGTWVAAENAETDWPIGIAAEGNEGVASEVKVTQGAIGYVELAYARQNRLTIGAVKTPGGAFQLPGRDGPDYPITARTWLVVDPARVSEERGKSLASFVRWALRDGVNQARAMEYTTLPPDTIARYDSLLTAMQFGPATATGCAASATGAASGRGS